MGIKAIFEPATWALVPFHFWSVAFFIFGAIVGSFLNVCIYRMPREESLIRPPSHCPHCGYSIPWYLNIPLGTWLYLRGKCANCRAAISARYFFVELLTALLFLAAWLQAGHQSVWLALVYCLFLSGLIVATFIDFEHFIIPDEITIGGMVAGFLCSFAVPSLHRAEAIAPSLLQSLLGIAAGMGFVYAVLRVGKLLFGRLKIVLEPNSKVVFTETELVLPDKRVSYDDIFYRKTDTITFEARMLELIDRCYRAARVRLSPEKLLIDEERFDPEQTPHMEAVAERMVLPREAMGFGDVKFMGAIGAFLGWKAVVFSLMASSIIGALVGVVLIAAGKQEWSGRLPYGPYIALAAVIWIFGGYRLFDWWTSAGWLEVGVQGF